DQRHLYGTSVRWYWEPGVADEAASGGWRGDASRTVVESLGTAGRAPGPVHANLAFRDPLVARPAALPAGRGDGRPWLRHPQSSHDAVDASIVEALAEVLSGARVLVVAGGSVGDAT